ncbi:hypothetical protein I4U23_012636 [Adineta vaga]|nr:hypothetical protein I4U23_012636 [Adineta vaga]
MSFKIEQLPVEILFIIFRHLEAHDLINAFGNLNSYFDSILTSPHLRVYANIDSSEDILSSTSNDSICSLINFENLYFVKTNDKTCETLVQFIQCHANHLIHLTSLTLSIRKEHCENIIDILPILTDLKYLSIKKTTHNNDGNNKRSVLSAILQMKNLRICILNEWFPKYGDTNFTRSNTLKKLHMNSTISTSFILLILQYMPNLRELQFDTLTWNEFCSFPREKFVHHHLAILKFDRMVAERSICEQLIRALPSLRHLSISYWPVGTTGDETYFINPNQFIRLVEHITDAHIDFDFSTYQYDKIDEIRGRLQACPWFRLKSTTDNYLDAETVFEICFRQVE